MERRRSLVGLFAVVAACSSTEHGTPSTKPDVADARGDDASAPSDAGTGDSAPRGGFVPTGCITDVTAGDHVFACDGFTYDVRLPAACLSANCGIVLDVHGFTMSGAIQDANTNMRAIGEREGFVVVQPNAKGGPPTASWDSADYDRVWAFFVAARQVYAIDPKRVHVTGFSQGGAMTWAFTCAHGDEIASSAPAALNGCSVDNLAATKRQVPVLYMHGKNDGIAKYDTFAGPQRDAVVTAWNMGAPTTVASDAAYTWSRYTNAEGTVFELIEHEYSSSSLILKGHCFPGSTDSKAVSGQLYSFACKPPTSFVWGEEVIKFFKAHPMP